MARHQPLGFRRMPWIIVAVLFSAVAAKAADQDFVWIEGEDALSKSVARHSWYNSVKTAELSGGEWLSNYGPSPGSAEYEFEIPAAGDHTFWIRANTVAGPAVSYQIDEGDWRQIDLTANVYDRANIAADDKPDMRFVAWCRVGQLSLAAGPHKIGFKLFGKTQNHGAIDCFLFTLGAFTPDGKRKPGEKLGLHDPGTWAFEPEWDTFDEESLLDLRRLNEASAGESGFVGRSADGDFVDGRGKPIRFWAVNTSVHTGYPMEDLARHARWLAKRGVNMVRFHGQLCPKNDGSQVTDVDRKALDDCWKLVAAMKKEGIYTTISPYWAVSCDVKPSWNVDGFPKGKPMALLFWDETLQQGYKAWVKALYTEPNPYTDIPLAKDPAVAIIQIQNEDSILFWSTQQVKGEQRRKLGRKFGDLIEATYGSLERAKAAWGGAGHKDDDFAGGVVGLYSIWELTQDKGNPRRRADQVKFYARTMHSFNKEMAAYYRSLGCTQLINAGNWKTADPVRMLDLERLSYSVNDVIGANKYYGGPHVNPNEARKSGYLVSQGDRFASISALMNPRGLPVNFKQLESFPSIISESSWVPPIRYQSEGPLLVAAYSSLTGMDVYYWFSCGNDIGFGRPMGKWQLTTPALVAGFPAAALAFRKDYIQRGEPVVHEQRAYDDMWNLRSPIIAEDSSFDPNRAGENLAPSSNVKQGVHPLAFLVGPVVTSYGGDPATSSVADLSTFIDDRSKTVRSITGQIELNHAVGICKLNAPKVQGVTGFLNQAGEIKLDSITLKSDNEYATLMVVAMDDRPLAESRKILVQVGTIARPYGWKVRDASVSGENKPGAADGKEILERGSAPWNVTNTQITLSMANPTLQEAILLDANGMPGRELPARHANGLFALELPPEAMYVILR